MNSNSPERSMSGPLSRVTALLSTAGSAIPATWLVGASILSVQLGAGVAKTLFPVLSPSTVVWLRFLISALILLCLARPVLRGHSRSDWLMVTGFGVSLVTMNYAIFEAISRIPLGVAVTIEFLGPLAVAIAGSRRWRDLVWVVLAGTGVALLGWDEGGGVTLAGIAFAAVAGVGWASYILFNAATGRRFPGISGLAVASVIGTVVVSPIGISQSTPDLFDPKVLLTALAVGLLSSAIPYSLEMRALRHIPPGVFGILMSLEPAAAALVGLVVLGELLTVAQWAAVACVVTASVGATRSAQV